MLRLQAGLSWTALFSDARSLAGFNVAPLGLIFWSSAFYYKDLIPTGSSFTELNFHAGLRMVALWIMQRTWMNYSRAASILPKKWSSPARLSFLAPRAISPPAS